MIPTLPADAVCAAVACGDFAQATALLDAHERELATALAAPDRVQAAAPWLALLAAQRGLLAELAHERTAAGQALQRLRGERRGVDAYRQERRA